jgi:hypothetical protein
MRRTVVAVTVAGLALVLLGGVLAATLRGAPAAVEVQPATAPLDLGPEDVYPSLAKDRVASAASYSQLFEPGQTLTTAAKPACPRYRRVRLTWAKRATTLDVSSRGAGAGKRTAVAYYARVAWVSQDEAGDFDEALFRISRSRLSTATGQVVKRDALVAAFTRDAVELCGLGAARTQTRRKLETLDHRITRIIELARFDSASGLSDGNAQ